MAYCTERQRHAADAATTNEPARPEVERASGSWVYSVGWRARSVSSASREDGGRSTLELDLPVYYSVSLVF